MTPVKWHDGASISKSFSKSDRSESYGVACLFLFATNAAVSEFRLPPQSYRFAAVSP
jgi:hypothetical protein